MIKSAVLILNCGKERCLKMLINTGSGLFFLHRTGVVNIPDSN